MIPVQSFTVEGQEMGRADRHAFSEIREGLPPLIIDLDGTEQRHL